MKKTEKIFTNSVNYVTIFKVLCYNPFKHALRSTSSLENIIINCQRLEPVQIHNICICNHLKELMSILGLFIVWRHGLSIGLDLGGIGSLSLNN